MNPLVGMLLFTAGSLGLCGLIWCAKTIALHQGWIVPRTEPIREWTEFDTALQNLGHQVSMSLGIIRLRDWLADRLARR